MDRPPTSVSARGVDKNSRQADTTPNIKFASTEDYDFPLIVFHCSNAVGTIMVAKDWLLTQYNVREYLGPEVLRMEWQDLAEVKHGQEGKLVLLEQAAWVEGREGKVPVAILALVIPKDPRVRFYYSIFASFKGLLTTLDTNGFIQVKATIEPDNKPHHGRLYVWMREEFLKAIKIPEHPDYLHAESITDFAPGIADPDTAMHRIEACEVLYNSRDDPRDLSDDRYIFKLHPAERELASQVQVSCAEYLLIKRNFFKDWYTDVFRSDKKVKDGELARTNYAHEQYMEKVYEWTVRRSRRLIAGWKVLGLLDQSQLMPWVAQGGMLADSAAKMTEEDVINAGGQGGGKTVAARGRT